MRPLLILAFIAPLFAADSPIGETRVAPWFQDKKGVLLLMFDDSMPSHVKNVVPELKKRGLSATFYVNPGKGEWAAFKTAWEKDIPSSPGMEYGNHTHTHQGIVSMDNGEQEIARCNDAIAKVFPDRKQPRLISFGVPGVKQGAWLITKEQLKELLDKHHLVERPTAHFATIHLKTAADMLQIVDKAIERGALDTVAFHGVGGEWLSATLATFKEFLDGLETRREKLWITDHISAYKYETERNRATVKTIEAGPSKIQLGVACTSDKDLFDQPLTFITKVPVDWQDVEVTQGSSKATVAAVNGELKFNALPYGEPITLAPLKK